MNFIIKKIKKKCNLLKKFNLKNTISIYISHNLSTKELFMIKNKIEKDTDMKIYNIDNKKYNKNIYNLRFFFINYSDIEYVKLNYDIYNIFYYIKNNDFNIEKLNNKLQYYIDVYYNFNKHNTLNLYESRCNIDIIHQDDLIRFKYIITEIFKHKYKDILKNIVNIKISYTFEEIIFWIELH